MPTTEPRTITHAPKATSPEPATMPPQAPVPHVPPTAKIQRRHLSVGFTMAFVGGAAALVGSFLPWASTTKPSLSFTGWEIYQEMKAADENAYLISHFWSGKVSPLFTGAVTAALAIAIVALAALVVLAPRRVVATKKRPGKPMLLPRVPALVTLASFLVAIAAGVVSVLNVAGFVDPTTVPLATAEPGFWITAAGLFAGAFGLVTAIAWIPKRKRIEAPPTPA
jgi:hypothetical protein